jgi:hypothetical protein
VSAPAGAATLTFLRPSFQSGAVGIEVFVDGRPYGKLRVKGRLTVSVPPGDHHVELVTGQGRSGVGSIRAASGDTEVTVKISALTGTPKLS